MNTFLVRIDWYCEWENKEISTWFIAGGDNVGDVAERANKWGGVPVTGFYIFPFEEGFLEISDSLADALLHQFSEEIECIRKDKK